MKIRITVFLLLVCSLSYSQGKRKLIGNKLQVLDLKNAKIIGLDSKGNAVDGSDYVDERVKDVTLYARDRPFATNAFSGYENDEDCVGGVRMRAFRGWTGNIPFPKCFGRGDKVRVYLRAKKEGKVGTEGIKATVYRYSGKKTFKNMSGTNKTTENYSIILLGEVTVSWKESDGVVQLIFLNTNSFVPNDGSNGTGIYIDWVRFVAVNDDVVDDKIKQSTADWAETNTEAFSFIKNKPTKLSQFSNDIYPVGFSKTANPYESGVDCNTITKVGETRFIGNAPNSPYPGFLGYVTCIGTGDVSNRAWQIATMYGTGASPYIRTLANGVWYKIYTELSLTKLSQLEADNIYTKIQSDEKYMPSWNKDYNDLINKPTNLVTEQRLTDSISKVRAVTYLNAGHKIALSDMDTLYIENKPLQSTDIRETGSPNGGYLMRVNGDGYTNPSEIYIDKGHISIGVKNDENNVSKLDIRGGKVELKNFDVGGANNGSISVSKEGVDVAGNIMERVVVRNDTIVGVGKHLTIPEGVKVIKGGYNLSVGFKNLTSIQFPISLEEIGEKSFYGSSLKSVALKDVKKVGAQAFYGCAGLTSVNLGDKLESSLKSVALKDVKKVGAQAFYGCAGLTSVNLGDKLEVIETLAFGYCEKIKEVIFPSTLTSIGAGAFDTSAIKNINLPAGCHYKATSFYKWEENGVNYPIIIGGILDD